MLLASTIRSPKVAFYGAYRWDGEQEIDNSNSLRLSKHTIVVSKSCLKTGMLRA